MSFRVRVLAWVAVVGLAAGLAGCSVATVAAKPYASGGHGHDCDRTGSQVLSSFRSVSETGGCFVVVCSHEGTCREVGR
jgi:hypothetical protein